MQENWIGKSEGVRFAFPHDIHDDDGTLIGDGRLYVFTTRADTIMGVTFCAVAPEHPLAAARRRGQPERSPRSSRPCKAGGTTEAELATQEKKGMPTGLFVDASAHRRADPGLGRQLRADELRRRRGDGRARRTTSATSRSPRSTASTSCRSSTSTASRLLLPTRWQDWYADKRARRDASTPTSYSGLSRTRPRSTRSPHALAHQRPRREADHLAPARLGRQPPALLGHADPDHPLRRRAASCRCPRRTCRSCCRKT